LSRAFRTAGRFSVIQPTPSATAYVTVCSTRVPRFL
jgi:hypothetical protein